MLSRLTIAAALLAATAYGQKVKTKTYSEPEQCAKTYRLAKGRVLTSAGLVEDPTVNAIMKDAVGDQMNQLKIADGGKDADLEVRFMGGNSAGLQVDDLTMGDVAMWNIGGPQPISGRAYKKSNLVIVVVDGKSNRTIWAAQCVDNFGDPNRLRERIQRAVSKAFTKFPKKLACG
ncbi:MAG TPA: DUF4136 domain-containing protein [Bryobacteraceae bacterium]|nr:DUF4136 domain-containing protein [Bryobacteraceae bacterium]